MNQETTLTKGQWYALIAALLGWTFDGVEMGLTPIVSRPALRDLLNVTDDAAVAMWNGRIVACSLGPENGPATNKKSYQRSDDFVTYAKVAMYCRPLQSVAKSSKISW